LLGLEGERVDVDASGRNVGVVLEGLDLVEVASLANLEAVVSVELEESRDRWVVAGKTLNTCNGVS